MFWQDSSDCWLCERHNYVKIEINQSKEIQDSEFMEVIQLSSILN
jgi:hypothetical protein